MSYILDTASIISFPENITHPVAEELLKNHTYRKKWNIVRNNQKNCITVGNYTKAEYSGAEYVVNITDDGIYISGLNYQAMMRGFATFLGKIKYNDSDDCFYADCECIKGKPSISFRCVHLCVFPETKLDLLKKSIRSCAMSKFSHIIFEFWGMFRFECMKELSWPFSYTKQEIKEIIEEARALGMEIIPMFNHLGHASSCREINGKHVILDQNPKYEYMFESYGWTWNFKRKDVYELLSNIRDELIDICGNGQYFHLGFDEAYSYGYDAEKAAQMIEYLNKLSKDLKSKGRRGIIWHDMLIPQKEFDGYVANSNKNISDMIIQKLDRNLIIADWQYDRHNETWKTSEWFKKNSFDVICCPWNDRQNIDEAVKTVVSNQLYGFMHTTWHTLYFGFGEMVYAGTVSFGTDSENLEDIHRLYCASLARKVLPSYGDYKKSGWNENMIGPGL